MGEALIIIKSAPGSVQAKRAVRLASDMAADLVLLQDGVCLAERGGLEGFCGTAHVLAEDLRMRGVGDLEKDVRELDYGQLVDLLAGADNVTGMF
jgi:sulfur relay protein TusB/DsrH